MNDHNIESKQIEKLVKAYEDMMQRVRKSLHQAQENTLPKLTEYIDEAQEKLVELGELSSEEAEKIAGYLKRDIHEAGSFLAETGEELETWLSLDVALIEQHLFDLFLTVADKSRLELIQFKQDIKMGSPYHTGEITSPGVLICKTCQKELHFHKTGHIPPCSGCSHTEFTRKHKGNISA